MEKMLTWNPDDNPGIRFLIGSEYLRIGKTAKATRIFNEEVDQYPPYHYELGLLHFLAGNPVAAATSLGRGLVPNGYVAETRAETRIRCPWRSRTTRTSPSRRLRMIMSRERVESYEGGDKCDEFRTAGVPSWAVGHGEL
ncbi:tetratricopeptide repeat protein [Ensifer aridi]|uniref:tetratricopeptide repeat protein n=1 Tax=Ensifer aridi TaxID=1708715 RepID=UPI0015E31D98|nr:hypothetical protein [Ensifer aridi]